MTQDKSIIRKYLLAKRSALTHLHIREAEKKAFQELIAHNCFQRAGTVMLYMDFKNECPTGKLIEIVQSSGKRLVLPLTDKDYKIIPYEIIPGNRTVWDCLTLSEYGVPEPNPELCRRLDPKEIDLVIVPGVAFDKMHNRIGYGKGCYDRFLPLLRSDAVKIALAYDFQILDSIPADSLDIKMDEIITVSI